MLQKCVLGGNYINYSQKQKQLPICYFIVMNVKYESGILVKKKYFTEKNPEDIFLTDTHNNMK